MKQKILPVVWYLSALLVFGSISFVETKVLGISPLIVMAIAWVFSIVVALAAGALPLRINPDLRFSTHSKIDGMGHVHQPMDFMVTMTFITVVCAVTCVVKMMRGR